MTSLVVGGLLVAILFLLSFLTKRRFGVLGLALAAGALLSTNWTSTLTPFIEQQGVTLVAPPLPVVVQSILIIGPPLILLAGGPTYNKMAWRIVGSLGFALLALAFLLDSLGVALNLDGAGLAAYRVLHQYQSLIIVVGLLGALLDVFFTRKPKGHEGRKSVH
jgi:hypothetical protein